MSKMFDEIMKLSIAERLLLVEAIWDSIPSEEQHPELTPEQANHVENRLKTYRKNPTDVMSWEEVKASLG